MPKAIRIHANGGPEVLSYDEVEVGRPGAGEALIKHHAIGLNFLDTYYRSGLYAAPHLPLVPGGEAAGEVLEVGSGVDWLKPGDRVAYTTPLGSYCEQRVIAAERLVKIPSGVTEEQAAAAMLKGLTAEYLLRRTYHVKPGDTVLYHAAAGGVGLLFGQWAKHLGAVTIGTAGSPEKVALAQQHGFDHVIDYSSQDFVAEVARITGGKKCDVVYDSVGKDTFAGSLDCLKSRGLLVSFGQSSGAIPLFNMAVLSQKGSLYVTRPTLFSYIAARDELETGASALFDVIEQGIVKVRINQRYLLADVAQAHADLEARKTTGTTILIP
jgi:NADPH2:quinone reductase